MIKNRHAFYHIRSTKASKLAKQAAAIIVNLSTRMKTFGYNSKLATSGAKLPLCEVEPKVIHETIYYIDYTKFELFLFNV